jgi:glycosyltransferase involved in cell wall biosynthesis
VTRDPGSPVVSVVVATYNRSNVLRYAIESVLGQTYPDWELLVVDDASTDDTQAVVEGFDDPRICYVGLGANFGDQSGPNNAGTLLARGRYLAFLNHDDLWLRDHLEVGVGVLEARGADLAFARCAVARPHTVEQMQAGEWSFRTRGEGRHGRYRPGDAVPASSWVLRRELVRTVGPWRPADTLYAAPSADWLFRAHRRGAHLVSTGQVGVLVFTSGGRRGSYALRVEDENAFFAQQLRDDPELPARVQQAIVEDNPTSGAPNERRNLVLARQLRRLRSLVVDPALAVVGLNPLEVRFAYRFRRRGRFIAELRGRRGLEPRRG